MSLDNFVVYKNKNFQFVLSNGYRISVGVEHDHYCDNRNPDLGGTEADRVCMQSSNCEVLVHDCNDNPVFLEYDELTKSYVVTDKPSADTELDPNPGYISFVSVERFSALLTSVIAFI